MQPIFLDTQKPSNLSSKKSARDSPFQKTSAQSAEGSHRTGFVGLPGKYKAPHAAGRHNI